jgi:hypothetical protein
MFGKSLGEIAQISAGWAVRDFLTEARRHGDQGKADVARAEGRTKKEEAEREGMGRRNRD